MALDDDESLAIMAWTSSIKLRVEIQADILRAIVLSLCRFVFLFAEQDSSTRRGNPNAMTLESRSFLSYKPLRT